MSFVGLVDHAQERASRVEWPRVDWIWAGTACVWALVVLGLLSAGWTFKFAGPLGLVYLGHGRRKLQPIWACTGLFMAPWFKLSMGLNWPQIVMGLGRKNDST